MDAGDYRRFADYIIARKRCVGVHTCMLVKERLGTSPLQEGWHAAGLAGR